MNTKLLFCHCLFITALETATLFAAEPPILDIEKGSLQGKSVFDYSIDQLTDVLGRPSVVKSEDCPIIYYHQAGLVFVCRSGTPAEAKIGQVFIFLSKVWDETNARHIEPYTSPLSRAIASTWKLDRAKSEFANLAFSSEENDKMKRLNKMAKDFRESSARIGNPVKTPWPKVDPVLDICDEATSVAASTEYGTIHLVYEPLTKFLEKICLQGK